MRTEFFVEYDLYDTTALQDAQESTESNSDFGNLELIKENIYVPQYGTLEHNFFVLDGSMEEFPDEPDNIVYFSKDFMQQNENNWHAGAELYGGDDLDGPIYDVHKKQTIVIQFSEYHTSYGITLYFANEYPLEIEVVWFDLAGIVNSRKRFFPDSLVYFCKNQVEEYGRIEITFLRALPYHYAKLQHIKYGTTITWGSDNIKSGKLVNDTDMISDKIKTDKLTFDFVDVEDEFNFGNPNGIHKTFQQNQRMLPYEMVEGKKILLGSFFLDSISTKKNVTKMSAVDYKGKLSNTDFLEGKIYTGEPAGEVIGDIMRVAEIEDYEVDEETANTTLYGTLKIQSCQKALREVLFACGSIINTSHRLNIEIRKANRLVSHNIPRSRKFSTTYQIDKYISDVNVKYKAWRLDDKVSQLTKGVYGAGINTIQLTNPAQDITANAGTILEQKPYYIVLQVTGEQKEVIISGKKYISEELGVTASIEHIKSGEVRNTKKFTGTLLNFESAQRVAEDILDYYQLQQIIKAKHLADDEKTGDWTEIQNVNPSYDGFIAGIESMSTDLTGGFISTSKCRGYFKTVTQYYYAGNNELYSEDSAGEII